MAGDNSKKRGPGESAGSGKCLLCGYEGRKNAIARHLENPHPVPPVTLTSPLPQQSGRGTGQSGRGRQRKGATGSVSDGQDGEDRLVRLCFEAVFDPRYWIYVDARADATLANLDKLLRSLWLECCGHLSAFRVGPIEPPMNARVGQVFHDKGQKFSYEYDFGSTTPLKGHVVGSRTGSLGRERVHLLARNNPLEWVCTECGAPATQICSACLDEDDSEGLFCETHASEHDHDGDIYLLPVVNSPRMGVCGYTG